MTEAETWQQEKKILTLYIYDSAGAIAHTITNDGIKTESMELSQTLEASKALAFKGCSAAVFKISLTDLADDVRGCRLRAVLAAGDYSYTIFDGVIWDQENQNHEDILTTLTAYDYMRSINALDVTEWAKGLTGITGLTAFELLQKFYDEVISANFEAVTMTDTGESWNGTTFTAEPDFSQFDSITGETFIKWLCQCGNVYGYMNAAALSFLRLETFSEPLYPAADLYPSGSLYPSDGSAGIEKIKKSQYISLDYEPYKVAKIGGVVVCDSEGVGEGYAPGTTAAANSLYIDSNPLAWAMDMQTLAAAIYARVKDLTYTPIDLDCAGMPYINIGDIIRASTNKRTVHSYILKRTLKGIQALRDNFSSDSDQYQPTHAASYSSITSENGKKILKIQADQVEMQALIADRATIEELKAVSIKVGNLEADHVTTSSFNSLSGTVSTLSSKAITTDNLSSKTISAGQISGGTLDCGKITVSNLSVTNSMISGQITGSHIDTSSFTSNGISCLSVTASSGITTQGLNFKGTALSLKSQTIAGVKINYLGY